MNAIQKKRFSLIALVVILTLVVPWAVLADQVKAVVVADGNDNIHAAWLNHDSILCPEDRYDL